MSSSSSTESMALRFPRAWVRTRSINSALLPRILRPFCFRYIFSSLLVSAFTSFSIVQEISGRMFLSLTLFLAFASRELKVLYVAFTCSLVHVVLGTYLLQRPFYRRGTFSLVEQFLYLDTWKKLVDLVSSGRHANIYGSPWTETPLVQPSLRHPSHVRVQENLR